MPSSYPKSFQADGLLEKVTDAITLAVDASVDSEIRGVSCGYLSSNGLWGAFANIRHSSRDECGELKSGIGELYALAHGMARITDHRRAYGMALPVRILTDCEATFSTVTEWMEGDRDLPDTWENFVAHGKLRKIRFLQQVVRKSPEISIKKISRNSHPLHAGADKLSGTALDVIQGRISKEGGPGACRRSAVMWLEDFRLRHGGKSSLYEDLMKQADDLEGYELMGVMVAAARAAGSPDEHDSALRTLRDVATVHLVDDAN
ncbi:hypothetical protein [Streptomyces violaceusniger]|uniref:RNase H type-1 domain-containing protein n=1 Tax=Streptomyces violaceusniger (strain Tu 4113) TaxID=653045 RepID=G2PHD5_STRV4|nr:hypothetical protein [Streptomyces violaceusniger]AEM88781.1 hypothetical protein Strvi_0004 [Streptomyces violaceusniger Tu 4113]